ncbi:hypothetical protein LX36DRAFT_30185 [Colletotrichum falcatum]|nr:hypothetical protein LX36DRAFT_30185 [Colletotrichum falcatum]
MTPRPSSPMLVAFGSLMLDLFCCCTRAYLCDLPREHHTMDGSASPLSSRSPKPRLPTRTRSATEVLGDGEEQGAFLTCRRKDYTSNNGEENQDRALGWKKQYVLDPNGSGNELVVDWTSNSAVPPGLSRKTFANRTNLPTSQSVLAGRTVPVADITNLNRNECS